VLAVQRALSDFGYGQLKLTGIYDPETRLAIQHFERDHKLPITGEISERVTRELANLTGRSMD
jgi:peptidoglycan hydrolase-like protein with peptidoglycan-binding domain